MSYNYPEPSLDPPEDTRRVVAECMVCYDDIREGDEAIRLPQHMGYACLCMRCIRMYHEYDLEADE